jgi:hypothetical protein
MCVTIFANLEKQRVLTTFECVSVVVVIKNATRMRRIILLSVVCLALPCCIY